MAEVIETVYSFFKDFIFGSGLSLTKALAFLIIGLIVVRIVVACIRSMTIKSRTLDNAASTFITSLVKVALYVVVAIIVLSTAGMDTASLVAAFAAVALAISLGLQDTLSGLTNGILIIFTKPFKQGDYISVDGTAGTVKEIRLFNTKLSTPDNLDIIIPNSKILGSNLTNYSAMPLRRVDIELPMSYTSDVEEVKKNVMEIIESDPRIVKYPAPMCRLSAYGDSALTYVVRAWVNNADYWDVRFDLMEKMYDMSHEKNLGIPFNQLDVHIIPENKEDK